MLQEYGSPFLDQLRNNETCKEPGNCSSIKNTVPAFLLPSRLSAVQISEVSVTMSMSKTFSRDLRRLQYPSSKCFPLVPIEDTGWYRVLIKYCGRLLRDKSTRRSGEDDSAGH